MWLSNLSLQKKVGFLVFAGLAGSLALFSWLGIQSVNESINRTLNERLIIANTLASHLDETLRSVLQELQNINLDVQNVTPEEFSSAADSLNMTLAASGISVQGTVLTDARGKVLLMEPESSVDVRTDLSQYTVVQHVLESGSPMISDLESIPLVTAPVVMATVPIGSREGHPEGVLISLIEIEQSTAFKPVITLGQTGYTEIVDSQGIVISRTKPGTQIQGFEKSDHPGHFADLIRQQQATVRTCHRCHETPESLKRAKDVLAFVPLSAASWGVGIRQSEEEALAPARQLKQRLLLVGIIILISAFLSVWLISQYMVRPISQLIAATRKVASGEFKATAMVKRGDEIGQLNNAFHRMVQELARSRDELTSRNAELTALNTIAATVNRSLKLSDVMESALLKVLEVTRSTAGAVFVVDPGNDRLELLSSIGSSLFFKCDGSRQADCACYQAIRSREPLMVTHPSQCPKLSAVQGDKVGRFVSLPLITKDQTLGILNVACSDDYPFTERDYKLLESICYHVGLAIENSILYEEAKQKERLRGELFSRVINAQEEERKRIARELHDEQGQILTGLIMAIESLESVVRPGEKQANEKLKHVKSLTLHALNEMRRITLDLRPSVLDDLGLVAAVRAYASSRLESTGIKVKFEVSGLFRRLPPDVEAALFRIIQETIHNIVKHAQAHFARILLKNENDKITIQVEDDGVGFNAAVVFSGKPRSQHLGLLGIRERVELLGGTFDVSSESGRGTHLTVEISAVTSPSSEVAQNR